MTAQYRIAAIVVLLALTVGFAAYYDVAAADNWPYPDGERLAEEPGAYDGETILVFGVVERVDGSELTMTVDDEIELIVRGFDEQVEPGGVVQVYGPIAENHRVQHAESTVVVNESRWDQLYKLVTSLLGIALTLGLFVRHWQIDRERIGFEVRNG